MEKDSQRRISDAKQVYEIIINHDQTRVEEIASGSEKIKKEQPDKPRNWKLFIPIAALFIIVFILIYTQLGQNSDDKEAIK